MTLTVAVAGVPPPLLAVHWYCIMSSVVSCLLTFTTSNEEVFESTTPLPCLVHVMVGSGLPDTLLAKLVLWPSTTITSFLWIFIGGSTMQIKKFKLWQKTQLQQHPKNNRYHRRFNGKLLAILIILYKIKIWKRERSGKNQLTMDSNESSSSL